jgi:N-methylhydantoinase A
MHAAAYGPAAGCNRIVVPTLASEFSAFGIAGSDARVVEELSAPMVAPFDTTRMNAVYAELEARARGRLTASGIDGQRIDVRRFVTVRYRGQTHSVETPVPGGAIDQSSLQLVFDGFRQAYEQKYGRGTTYERAELQVTTFRVHGFGRLHPPTLALHVAGAPDARAAIDAQRDVYFGEVGRALPTPVYRAELLRAGHAFSGPAIVEAIDTTIVIHPDQRALVDPYLNVVISAGL